MPLSKEELMKTRWMQIAGWPGMERDRFEVGLILTDGGKECVRNQDGDPMVAISFNAYPHLFKRLKWWEERAESDMPEWISSIGKNLFAKVTNVFLFDINEMCMALFPQLGENGEEHECFYKNYLPSTLEEYNSFQSKLK